MADFIQAQPPRSRVNNLLVSPDSSSENFVEELSCCVVDIAALDATHIRCFHCQEMGHIKRECPKHLAGLPPVAPSPRPSFPQRAPVRPSGSRFPPQHARSTPRVNQVVAVVPPVNPDPGPVAQDRPEGQLAYDPTWEEGEGEE